MIEEQPGPVRFGEALGAGVNSAFVNLRSEIMKDGLYLPKIRHLSRWRVLRQFDATPASNSTKM